MPKSALLFVVVIISCGTLFSQHHLKFDEHMLDIDSVMVRNKVESRTSTQTITMNDEMRDPFRKEIRTYDTNQRIVRFEQFNPPYFILADGALIDFIYDENGQLLEERVDSTVVSDMNFTFSVNWDSIASVTSWFKEFDTQGRLIREYSVNKLTNALLREVLYAYNATGQLVKETVCVQNTEVSVIAYTWNDNGLPAGKAETYFGEYYYKQETSYSYTFYP